MAFTQSDLDALEIAIATGATSFSYEGKTVSYRSLDEMLRVRGIMQQALGLTSGSSTMVAAHNRGFSSSGFESDS